MSTASSDKTKRNSCAKFWSNLLCQYYFDDILKIWQDAYNGWCAVEWTKKMSLLLYWKKNLTNIFTRLYSKYCIRFNCYRMIQNYEH